MDVSSKIKIIPIELPFLRVFAEYLWNNQKGRYPDLSDILIVFPSQRNKFYFRRYLLGVSKMSGIISPTMFTVEELIDYIYERLGGKGAKDLTKLERNIVLKGVVDSLRIDLWRDLDFLRFVSIGDRLLSFYDELQKGDVSLDEIEDLKDRLHFPEKYSENELPIIRRIFQDYSKALIESGYTDTAHKYSLIKREFEPEVLCEYSYVYISGLIAATKTECSIIKKLLLGDSSELIIHSNIDDIREDLSSPYYHHHRILSYLDVSVDNIGVIGEKEVRSKPKIEIAGFKNEIQETFSIKDILSDLKERYEPHRIAVILTDNRLVSSLKVALRSEGHDYNLSMGLPLSQTLFYSFLYILRDLVKGNFYHKDFLAFMRHPLMKNAEIDGSEARTIIYSIERKMVKNNMVYFRLEDFDDESIKPVIDLIRKFTEKVNIDCNFTDYLRGIEDMLSLVLSLNKDFMSSGILGISDFLDRIHRLSKLIISEDIFPNGIDKLDFLLRVLKDANYSIKGDPFRGIQLIGVLEARNLDFDCVLIPSMNEGIFPQKSEKDLFLPAKLREEAGLPYDKERENLYYFYFTQLTSGKREVFISYVKKEDRDVQSRFIDGLIEEGVRSEDIAMGLNKGRERSLLTVEKDSFTVRRLEDMVYTPSSLKNYRECPYRFYMMHILGIREPESIVEEPGALEWGNIIHRALQRFYSRNFPAGIRENQYKKAESILFSLMKESLFAEMGYLKASALFDLEVYNRRMSRFLKEDIKRFQKGYRINFVEKKLEYQMKINNREIKFAGKTDRIDILGDKFYIIDYKTGRAIDRKSYSLGNGFCEFQLPLYALIFSDGDFEKIGGLIYYYISKDGIKVLDIMEDGYLEDFHKGILYPTLGEILDPNVDFYRTDDDDKCRVCAYRWFCSR